MYNAMQCTCISYTKCHFLKSFKIVWRVNAIHRRLWRNKWMIMSVGMLRRSEEEYMVAWHGGPQASQALLWDELLLSSLKSNSVLQFWIILLDSNSFMIWLPRFLNNSFSLWHHGCCQRLFLYYECKVVYSRALFSV